MDDGECWLLKPAYSWLLAEQDCLPCSGTGSASGRHLARQGTDREGIGAAWANHVDDARARRVRHCDGRGAAHNNGAAGQQGRLLCRLRDGLRCSTTRGRAVRSAI